MSLWPETVADRERREHAHEHRHEHAPTFKGLWYVVEKTVRPPSNCRGCGATIYWAKTAFGKNMPVDCNEPGAWPPTATDTGYGRTHFETCPKANDFSHGRKPDG